MQNLVISIVVIILTMQLRYLIGSPLLDNDFDERFIRADETFLPTDDFATVTNEKLLKLKELADAAHDPKLHELYRAVNHYVQMAKKNNEYVLWKYDANQEGLVLTLQQNPNGILYYG